MKRAKITQAPLDRILHTGGDLTDRLLQREESIAKPAPKATKPKSPRAAKSQSAAPAPSARPAADLPEFTPYRTVEPKPEAVRGPTPEAPGVRVPKAVSLKDALSETEQAIAALVAAAESDPAKYNLAVRYRLDALVHHLKQVAEFISQHS